MEIHVTKITDIHAVRNGHIVIHADMNPCNILDFLASVDDGYIAEYIGLHNIQPKLPF